MVHVLFLQVNKVWFEKSPLWGSPAGSIEMFMNYEQQKLNNACGNNACGIQTHAKQPQMACVRLFGLQTVSRQLGPDEITSAILGCPALGMDDISISYSI